MSRHTINVLVWRVVADRHLKSVILDSPYLNLELRKTMDCSSLYHKPRKFVVSSLNVHWNGKEGMKSDQMIVAHGGHTGDASIRIPFARPLQGVRPLPDLGLIDSKRLLRGASVFTQATNLQLRGPRELVQIAHYSIKAVVGRHIPCLKLYR